MSTVRYRAAWAGRVEQEARMEGRLHPSPGAGREAETDWPRGRGCIPTAGHRVPVGRGQLSLQLEVSSGLKGTGPRRAGRARVGDGDSRETCTRRPQAPSCPTLGNQTLLWEVLRHRGRGLGDHGLSWGTHEALGSTRRVKWRSVSGNVRPLPLPAPRNPADRCPSKI